MERWALDADRTPDTQPAGPRAVLEAFDRAIAHEAHVLVEQPDLTWQQLYNRLQWQGGAVQERLAPQRERLGFPGARAWLRTLTPFPESGAVIRTLKGHAKAVHALAFSPDGRRIVSASFDRTLKLWDAESGAELDNLVGHTGPVRACAFSPDGRRIVSGSEDRTLKLWDAEAGAQLETLNGHTDNVEACAFSPDGRRIVSASWDETLKVWDAESGAELDTLEGHTNHVLACAFSPNGRAIVSASRDSTVKLWEADGGDPLATLPLLSVLRAVAVHPWLPRAVCGSDSGAICRMEFEGIESRSIVVTAAEREEGPVIRCPACWVEHLLAPERLGSEITCSTPDCGLNLRINPFVLHVSEKLGWWSRLRRRPR